MNNSTLVPYTLQLSGSTLTVPPGLASASRSDDLLFQGLYPLLLTLLLQGTHPLVEEVTREQLQRDASEEVLADEERGTVWPLRVT